MARSPSALLEGLLGEEGGVATETRMQVVMAASAAVISGLYVVSPVVSALAGPFAVSEAAIGQLITAYTAPGIVLVPVFGALADRYGPRPVLAFGLVLFGVSGSAIALAPTFEVALAFRVVQGVGYAAVNPISVSILGTLYDGGRETTAQGLRTLSIQLAGLVVPPISGTIVAVGWQYPFLLYLAAIPTGVWAWFVIPRATTGEPTDLRRYVADLRAALARPALAALVLSFAARFAMVFGMLAYVSVLLSARGASAFEIGVVVGLVGLVGMVGSTQAGRIVAAVDPVLGLIAGFAALGAGMVGMGLAPSLPLVIPGLVVLALGAGVTGPVQKSLVNQRSPPDVRAGTVSAAVVFQAVGAAGGPFLMGVLLTAVGVGELFVVVGAGLGLLAVALGWVTYLGGTPADAPDG